MAALERSVEESLRDGLKACPELKEADKYLYLTIKGNGIELQARIEQVLFQGQGSIFSFELIENSANGQVTGKIESEEVYGFVTAGLFACSGHSLYVGKIDFHLAQGEKRWTTRLRSGMGEESNDRRHLVLSEVSVRLGLSVNPLQENGLVILKEGKLNPALLAPEARQLFKPYLF